MMATMVAVNKNTKSARFIVFLLVVIVTHILHPYIGFASPLSEAVWKGDIDV